MTSYCGFGYLGNLLSWLILFWICVVFRGFAAVAFVALLVALVVVLWLFVVLFGF